MSKFLFNHVALSVRDVDESFDFYKKVFNLKEIKNTASNSKTRWLSLGEGKQLHLIPYKTPVFEIKVNKAIHFALTTANVRSFVQHLEAVNVNYTDWKDTPKKDYVRKDGIQQVYFQDPNGYWIEVNNALS